ncbi:hypothetical protein [Heyndrickxia acidicola]|uniref:Uncharacterized protein n=1 Tax=Heyndrickxia acidicola TaxID=209389 RepID=A0ABU6MEE4_9BACI|nr:hypothetical protein [Heyndrickxia acidicola]MED1203037.1 hypothetical protein [Heyndrickxia acidicola]
MDKAPKDESNEGLNQLFEIINAKGDEGGLREIVSRSSEKNNHKKQENRENKY